MVPECRFCVGVSEPNQVDVVNERIGGKEQV
jgi:hypothetical protein